MEQALSNTAFVSFLKRMVGQPYWYGTVLYNCTEELLQRKAKQYPKHYGASRMPKYKKAIAQKQVCADCVGLGKGFVWTNGGETVFEAIGTGNKIVSHYQSNGCPDNSADGMFNYAKRVGKAHGSISTIPEVPGLAVRKKGHVGYYIGNGKVVEAYGFAKGIVITQLKDRPWTDWYEFPGIQYKEMAQPEYTLGQRTLHKGDSGNDVRQLQVELLKMGYELTLNGKYDETTFKAVKEFQKDQGLTVDGIAGKNTFAALLKGENHPTLRKGSRGNEVKELQTVLMALGYDLGKYGADGEFGAATENAVRAFQKDKNLKVDGIVGKATWKALGV